MKQMVFVALLAGMYLMTALARQADPPVELGQVDWGRDLEAAKRQSAETGKPVLVLFQEVPG
jgi:hypothetical protein